MKHSHSVGVLAAATLCAALGAHAQPAADKPAAKPPATFPTGPGSLDGVWINSGFKDVRPITGFAQVQPEPPPGQKAVMRPLLTADKQPVPMRPEIEKIVTGRRSTPWLDDSTQRCSTPGMPFSVSTPAQSPMQIVETPGQKQITMLYEQYIDFRIVNMDRPHAAHLTPTAMGDSVGHWEGDTLVIDTIAISDKTSIMGFIPHSDQLHVVEHMRRTGPTTMQNIITIDDPKTFTRPWNMLAQGTPNLRQVPGMRITEFVCENNRFNEGS